MTENYITFNTTANGITIPAPERQLTLADGYILRLLEPAVPIWSCM